MEGQVFIMLLQTLQTYVQLSPIDIIGEDFAVNGFFDIVSQDLAINGYWAR